MSDLIDREFIKRLGGECIARRDRETGELIAITGIDLLPSAQPEIIRCKDCKWFGKGGCAIEIVDDSDKPTENDFCSFAERREE